MITKHDINDEFDFENYLRIAFSDWNLVTISLILRSSTRICNFGNQQWYGIKLASLKETKSRYVLENILNSS